MGSILGTSRRTRVLATSTTPLAIRPEVLLDVVPLPVGHPGAAGALAPESPAEPGDPGDLSPAVELFWARAEAARSDLTVDDRALGLMTEICHHLDGLPLAIEIVAAQVRAFPLEHLAQVVATDPAFVAHPWRDADDRHRSLVANVEWSRRLLTDEEVDALSALAVLAPDFGLDSAAAMLDLPAVDTHRIVASLVQRSMLVSDDQTGRYRMLNHLRRVCLDLAGAGPPPGAAGPTGQVVCRAGRPLGARGNRAGGAGRRGPGRRGQPPRRGRLVHRRG